MLFNSWEFIGLFLPATLIGFFLCSHFTQRNIVLIWLVAASLFFYGWWNPKYVLLIVLSISFNFFVSLVLQRVKKHAKKILCIGITGNIVLLGYYKYANFFIDTVNSIASTDFHLATILLPLGISFFTFQQITYLIDVYKEKVQEHSFLHYALFVSFFPQLIAGPIVHHADVLPQFTKKGSLNIRSEYIAVGLSIFIIGLCKKVVIADTIAQFSNQIFDAADSGIMPSTFEGWIGAVSYTLQLYFDFSGYSDMAIGVARMFGIILPLNFYSPYKATSIIEFWRRWHITLSTFLRDYLYIPLGGNRKGPVRQMVNVGVTMLLGGLWHGAGWTFVFWGALHGVYLIVNRVWSIFFPSKKQTWRRMFSWLLTMLAVVVSWVFFRAQSFSAAVIMLKSMFGIHSGEGGIIDAYTWKLSLVMVVAFSCIAFFMPNTQQYMGRYNPSLAHKKFKVPSYIQWSPTTVHALWIAILALTAFVCMAFSQESEFLYFQF